MDALNRMGNETGLMYYFLGLERRAKKCLWVRLCWVNGTLQRKAARPDEQLLCKEWVTVWNGGGVKIVERKSTVVKEYDYDEEFRHLSYTASVIGSWAAAETELAKIAKRATTVFMCKPGLRDCGANIVASAIGRRLRPLRRCDCCIRHDRWWTLRDGGRYADRTVAQKRFA